LRVLLIAEACNPEWVSVPLEGWSHSQAIGRKVDAHLVTQVRNRDAIARAGLRERVDFTAINSEAIEARIYRLADKLRGGSNKGWTLVTGLAALSYPYFEHLAWQAFGRRIRAGEFDVVHRLTPLSPTMPSMLAGKCREAGVPFVLGPLNGGVPWPREFDAARRKEKEWLSYVRDGYRLLPGFHSTRQNASAIITGSRDTWEQMPAGYRRKCVYIPENAIDPARFAKRRTRAARLPIRCAFVGRLVPYKGADMLLEAAAPLVREGKLAIDIIGDGPQRAELEAIIAREGIQAGVTLAGWVPHAKIQDRLIDADLFTFPSIREFGGAVALEAMAVGVVPVVVGYGGPAELVTDRTGWRVPIGSRQQIIASLRALLAELAGHPEQIDAKSGPAYERAHRQFTWDAKAEQVLAVYRWVTGAAPEKPSFGMPLPDLAGDQ
jgi:glycosyltransferase involved in cell wall biosynthesis